eukprot:TRINITY_DN22190_c0_g1_i1.p1 TRINITY_DN22190_c0_g1~~TRINITY_DN22190_c0_g1_i1.p1  ORF type:complete len:191 (-),score=48.90 TRINITY_DN22190_c0_g1_i1:35-583(-)
MGSSPASAACASVSTSVDRTKMQPPPYSFLLLPLLSLLLPASCSDWTYKLEDHSGPSHWEYGCKGDHQSPINIPSTGLESVTFPALSFSNYDLEPAAAILRNNGHSAKLSTEPASAAETPVLSGGGLPHSYKFAQIHFHWGAEDGRGSEHLVGDTAYPHGDAPGPLQGHPQQYKGCSSRRSL